MKIFIFSLLIFASAGAFADCEDFAERFASRHGGYELTSRELNLSTGTFYQFFFNRQSDGGEERCNILVTRHHGLYSGEGECYIVHMPLINSLNCRKISRRR